MSDFSEILAEFKAAEEPDAVVALVDDKDLRNGVSAWKAVNIQFQPQQACPFEDEVSRWNWTWQQIRYDKSTFAVVAGVKDQDADRLLTRLIGLRLIYPDGTISTYARQYLQAVVMSKLPKPRGRPPKDKDEKKDEK